jgi:hypothetical protein
LFIEFSFSLLSKPEPGKGKKLHAFAGCQTNERRGSSEVGGTIRVPGFRSICLT